MGKRKVVKEEEAFDSDAEYSEEEAPKKAAKAKKAAAPRKKEPPNEPYEDDGWNIVPPSLMWR